MIGKGKGRRLTGVCVCVTYCRVHIWFHLLLVVCLIVPQVHCSEAAVVL